MRGVSDSTFVLNIFSLSESLMMDEDDDKLILKLRQKNLSIIILEDLDILYTSNFI
jgi:hypothetical protein